MITIQVTLDEKENKILENFKYEKRIKNKREALKKLIVEYGLLYIKMKGGTS